MNNFAKNTKAPAIIRGWTGRRLQLQRTTSKAADKSVRPTRALHGAGGLSVTNEQPRKKHEGPGDHPGLDWTPSATSKDNVKGGGQECPPHTSIAWCRGLVCDE